jgi:hypothetical protein
MGKSQWTSANRPLSATKPWARSLVLSVRCRLMCTLPPRAGPPAPRPGPGGGDGSAGLGVAGGRAARARCPTAAGPRPDGVPRWGRPVAGLGSGERAASGVLVADGTTGAGGAAFAAGLALGAGQLEAAGRAGGDPAASQQMQRRLLVVECGSAVLGTSHGRVWVAMMVADGGGRRVRVGAANRLQAAVQVTAMAPSSPGVV